MSKTKNNLTSIEVTGSINSSYKVAQGNISLNNIQYKIGNNTEVSVEQLTASNSIISFSENCNLTTSNFMVKNATFSTQKDRKTDLEKAQELTYSGGKLVVQENTIVKLSSGSYSCNNFDMFEGSTLIIPENTKLEINELGFMTSAKIIMPHKNGDFEDHGIVTANSTLLGLGCEGVSIIFDNNYQATNEIEEINCSGAILNDDNSDC